MNPNSAHQRWSFWQYRVYATARPSFAWVKRHCARFGRVLFGSVSEMRIVCATDEHGRLYWEIAVLSEGHPIHDAAYVEWMHQQWRRFFRHGFGPSADVRAHARLEAGDRQDGRPADQLVLLPSLRLYNDG